MFCSMCQCEFAGFSGKCPVCRGPLVQRQSQTARGFEKALSYDALVGLVKKNDDRLTVDLVATDVNKEKKWNFPYLGYGFAWTKRLQGIVGGIGVDLLTVGVGIEKKWGFPYLGYGYAWEKEMEGHIGGNMLTLAAAEVAREKKWGFPYQGYGYAWTDRMSGACGKVLRAELRTVSVGREKEWRFPYQGYGFAWMDKATLTLSLK